MTDTIFALSSGQAPAGIAVIRVSGPDAGNALIALAGALSQPRIMSLRKLTDPDGGLLDEAVVVWLPGPGTVSGEDMAELHCHGGRAVIAVVEGALGQIPGLRHAEAGEFTRRAFANGRIDLAQAEGLGDLLTAETELQRQAALGNSTGALSRDVARWREQLLVLSAQVEAALDFSDEDDVSELPDEFTASLRDFAGELAERLERPTIERLGEGLRVVLAGPPNAGKSTLFNALTDSDAAITAPIAGTTRDIIERNVTVAGVPFTFVDTAGLRDDALDPVETIGIDRARAQLACADIIIWLGQEGEGPDNAWEVETRIDDPGPSAARKSQPRFCVSAVTGEGIGELRNALLVQAGTIMPKPGEAALNRRQSKLVEAAQHELADAVAVTDPLIIGEQLRRVRLAFDTLVGYTSTEEMLDNLFGRFCIGK